MGEHECVICRVPWSDPAHLRTMRSEIGSIWRGNPGQLVPARQWMRENLPTSAQRLIVAGDDGFIRTWGQGDPVGRVAAMEWKTYGAQLDTPTAYSFRCLNAGSFTGWFAIRLRDGHVPSELMHYPSACDCGLPEQPEVAEAITVQWSPADGEPHKTIETAESLVGAMLDFIGYHEGGDRWVAAVAGQRT